MIRTYKLRQTRQGVYDQTYKQTDKNRGYFKYIDNNYFIIGALKPLSFLKILKFIGNMINNKV